jgi:hypothetical protein
LTTFLHLLFFVQSISLNKDPMVQKGFINTHQEQSVFIKAKVNRLISAMTKRWTHVHKN